MHHARTYISQKPFFAREFLTYEGIFLVPCIEKIQFLTFKIIQCISSKPKLLVLHKFSALPNRDKHN
jgi:hypothetical protein